MFTMKFFAVSALTVIFTVQNGLAAKVHKLPKYLKTCKYQVPENEVGDCIGVAMEDALRTMKNGEPSLGIQSLDPLLVSSMDILQGNGPVSLSINHKNLNIYGISLCKVTKNEFKKSDGTLKGHMMCPKITLDGDYELNGRVLLLPVRGKGRSIITLDKNECDFVAHGQHVMKNGTLYERYNKIEFKFQPKKMTLDFQNLFGGDRALSRTMNEFINQNWREILREMKPSYEAVFENVFKDTLDRVFSKIPVKDILPDYYSTTKAPTS